MARITDLFGDTETTHIDVGNSRVNITYRPNAVTPRMQKAFDRVQRLARRTREYDGADMDEVPEGLLDEISDADIPGFMVTAVCRTVTGWDLEDPDGQPYPVTEESVADLPTEFLQDVIAAVMRREKEPLDEGEDATSEA